MTDCWVMMRQTDGAEEVTVLGVYATTEGVETRASRIAKANTQYPMTQQGELRWRLGPDYDEGFFGNKPITVWAVKSKYNEV